MNTEKPKFIYLLSYDGSKEDIELDAAVYTISDLKQLIVNSYADNGDIIIQESFIIRKGVIHFKYITFDDGNIESDKYCFFKIPLV
jgi:hypothetical protein